MYDFDVLQGKSFYLDMKLLKREHKCELIGMVCGVVHFKCSRKIPKNLLNWTNRDGGDRNETLQQRI